MLSLFAVSTGFIAVIIPTLLILMVLISIATVVLVMLQESATNNISALTGGKDANVNKNTKKLRSRENTLKLLTVICGALLLVISVLFFIFKALA